MAAGAANQFRDDDLTLNTATDLSALQYHVVKISAEQTCAAATADTDVPLGILQNKPTSGEAARVRTAGKSKAVAGAAITVGDRLEVNASSRVITWATSGFVVGKALQAAAANGETIEIVVGIGEETAP